MKNIFVRQNSRTAPPGFFFLTTQETHFPAKNKKKMLLSCFSGSGEVCGCILCFFLEDEFKNLSVFFKFKFRKNRPKTARKLRLSRHFSIWGRSSKVFFPTPGEVREHESFPAWRSFSPGEVREFLP